MSVLRRLLRVPKLFVIAAVMVQVIALHGQTIKNDYWTPNSNVLGVAEDENYIYMGGGFNVVGPNKSYAVKSGLTTASEDPNFPVISGVVYAIEPDGQGGWYVGGDFTKVGGLDRKYIARIRADGSITDFSMNLNGYVRAIHLNANGLYLGGAFNTLGGVTSYGLIRVNPETAQWDTTFKGSSNPIVYSITSNNNQLYVAGSMNAFRDGAQGYTQRYIGKISETTGLFDQSWRPVLNTAVYSLDSDSTGVYAGGLFQTVNTLSIKYLTKLNHTTAAPVDGFSQVIQGFVNAVKVKGDKLYIGGAFFNINSNSQFSRLARLNSTTGVPDAGWGSSQGSAINTVHLAGPHLYIGSSSVGSYYGIARVFESSGQKDDSWRLQAKGDVLAIGISGSNMLAGGNFATVDGVFQNTLCRINKSTGIMDTTFRPDIVGGVYRIYPDGDNLYIFGEIITVNGVPRSKAAKINKNTGELDLNWNPNVTGPTSPVTAVRDIYVLENSIYLAGSFTSVSGQTRNSLAKISKSTGELDMNWAPASNGIVHAVAGDGKAIYIGGDFTEISSMPKVRLAKLDSATGAVMASWNPSADAVVYDMMQLDTSIYIAGLFTSVSGIGKQRTAKLGMQSGLVDGGFTANLNNSGHALATDGTNIYIGGQFTSINSIPAELLGRINKNTGALNPSYSTMLTGTRVQNMLYSNNRLLAVGIFYSTNGNVTSNMAHISYETAPVATTGSVTGVTTNGVTLQGMANPNGLPSQAYFEYGTTTSFGQTTSSVSVGSGTVNVPINSNLTGLQAGTRYFYRLRVFSGTIVSVGETKTFTTQLPQMPAVVTLAADSVTDLSARLNATVNPNGSLTKYYFRYTDGNTVYFTDSVSAGSGTVNISVSKKVQGLLPQTTYSFRVVAFNEGGSISGSDMQFTTSQAQPTVVTGTAEPVYQTVAYITGSVNSAGLSTKAVADYGSTVSYGFVSDTVDVGAGVVPSAVTIKLTGLTPGTTYHYRLRLIRAAGSSVGLDSVLTTRTNPVAVAPSGAGTYNNPRRITSIENLLWINQNSSSWASYFLQINDIDAAATKYWYDGAGFPTIGVQTTGRFGGIYVGQGYKIKNLYINRPENTQVALMADISGLILDLNIVDAYVKGKSSVGILAGTLSGTIINCNTSGTVEGSSNSLGGLAGYSTSVGRISYSSSMANVYGDTSSSIGVGGLVGIHYQGQITNSFATGNVTGLTRVGGLAGDQASAIIKNSYARGSVYASSSRAGGLVGLITGSPNITHSYASGFVTSPSLVGGLVGTTSGLTAQVFSAPFWDQESSGMTTSAVGYPRTTLQMKTNSTFRDSNWNWGIDWSRENNINDGYPYLVPMPPILPTIATNGASPVGINTATLKATAKANAVQAWGYFDYGTTTNYGMKSDTVALGWAMFNVAVTRNLTGLQPNTLYHYRFVAFNTDTIAYGLDSVFTTLPSPAPLVTTLKADNITSTGARLNGIVNANSLATQYYFEYKTGSTVKRTDTLSAGSGTTNDTVRITVSGLTPASIYNYKVVAFNTGGSASGGDSSFTTPALPVPVAITGSPVNIMPKSVTLNAKINPSGLLTRAVFEYDTTTAYAKKSDTLTVGSGDTLVNISGMLNNLKPNTLYHYRIKAFNSSGTSFGADSVFTTPVQPKPFVQTLQADSIGIYSLRLRGRVNPLGDSTKYYFEYIVGSVVSRTDTVYIGSGFDTVMVTKYLTGLFPNAPYSYRIIAFNSAGVSQGTLLGSNTLVPPKPLAFTGSAGEITQNRVRLYGTINPQGDSTYWYFEYGTTTAYGMRSDTLYVGRGFTNVGVNKYINNLLPNTQYYYRIAAYNSAGLTNAGGTNFITLAPVLALTSPVGGEGYEPASTQNITWNAAAVDTMKIEFSSDNGNTWNLVVDNRLTTGGSYSWVVPTVATTDGKIRITSRGVTPEIVSMSTGVFTIASSSLANQPTGTNMALNGNSFPDNGNGTAVGDSGTVINTTNGGTTWATPPAPIEGIGIRNLNDISSPSKWTRYAAGDSGTIYKSSNAGLNWSLVNTSSNQNFFSVVFTDTVTGTITGSNGTILKTTNGGSNWSAQTSGTTKALRDIYFTNASTATAVGDTGTILFTSNGGATWSAQNSGTTQNLHGVWFVKNAGVHQIGYAVGDSGTIVKTTNGGANWNVLLSPTSKKLNDIAFYTPERGSAVGDGGVVIYTTNGGSMWKSLVGTGSRNINSIAIPNSGGLMFLAGSNGSAFKDTVGIVPVELTSFTASNANGKVILNWVTASELNNAGFDVERALNTTQTEKTFTKVGEVAGKGTTVQISEYTFIDNVSTLGNYVYRLKQKDYDGTVSYSPEVEITLDAPMEFALSQNYPNPFNPSTQIKYQLPEASDVLLEVYDIQGSLIKRLVSGKQEAGYYQVTFNAGKLSTGVYIYRLTAGKFNKTMKLMLMK